MKNLCQFSRSAGLDLKRSPECAAGVPMCGQIWYKKSTEGEERKEKDDNGGQEEQNDENTEDMHSYNNSVLPFSPHKT